MPRGLIFQTWFMVSISTQAVIKSSKYHSHNQEYNPDCYKKSQCIDRAIFESRMTRTVNKNPEHIIYLEGTRTPDMIP